MFDRTTIMLDTGPHSSLPNFLQSPKSKLHFCTYSLQVDKPIGCQCKIFSAFHMPKNH